MKISFDINQTASLRSLIPDSKEDVELTLTGVTWNTKKAALEDLLTEIKQHPQIKHIAFDKFDSPYSTTFCTGLLNLGIKWKSDYTRDRAPNVYKSAAKTAGTPSTPDDRPARACIR